MVCVRITGVRYIKSRIVNVASRLGHPQNGRAAYSHER